jgi:hypothetical protein
VVFRVLHLNLSCLVLQLRGAVVGLRLAPVRFRGAIASGGFRLADRLALALERTRLTFSGTLFARPGVPRQVLIVHT